MREGEKGEEGESGKSSRACILKYFEVEKRQARWQRHGGLQDRAAVGRARLVYVRASGRSPEEAARWCVRWGSEGAGAASPSPAKNVWLAMAVGRGVSGWSMMNG